VGALCEVLGGPAEVRVSLHAGVEPVERARRVALDEVELGAGDDGRDARQVRGDRAGSVGVSADEQGGEGGVTVLVRRGRSARIRSEGAPRAARPPGGRLGADEALPLRREDPDELGVPPEAAQDGVDEPLPSAPGRSPREAARTPTVKPNRTPSRWSSRSGRSR